MIETVRSKMLNLTKGVKLKVIVEEPVFLGYFNTSKVKADHIYDCLAASGCLMAKNITDDYKLEKHEIFDGTFTYDIPRGAHCIIEKVDRNEYWVGYNSLSFYYHFDETNIPDIIDVDLAFRLDD